jgi:hypothetical protein
MEWPRNDASERRVLHSQTVPDKILNELWDDVHLKASITYIHEHPKSVRFLPSDQKCCFHKSVRWQNQTNFGCSYNQGLIKGSNHYTIIYKATDDILLLFHTYQLYVFSRQSLNVHAETACKKRESRDTEVEALLSKTFPHGTRDRCYDF